MLVMAVSKRDVMEGEFQYKQWSYGVMEKMRSKAHQGGLLAALSSMREGEGWRTVERPSFHSLR